MAMGRCPAFYIKPCFAPLLHGPWAQAPENVARAISVSLLSSHATLETNLR
jgi:hypothetical protein